ncbi:MAG: sensor histidine kinase [Chroococcidiopsidaceae cyanobacterium CP_BM_ER_R8_30]|nr:sensor histidine kinase [Chroococcidiopsidaceae cyanobacterium CP_BM_ER_R8_30]
MLTSASSEFITLCHSQVALLTQGLGANLSIVYLTEELVEGEMPKTGLIPVVAYPEAAMWERSNALAFLPGEVMSDDTLLLGTPPEMTIDADSDHLQKPEARTAKNKPQEADRALILNRQIVLPLIHEGLMLGLLVTGREDRAWNERERTEIERIAQTLTLARLLDQRREWALAELSQQQRLQAEQRDLLHNLLHQFRNSLMALRTFGKLLLKRLIPEDANHGVAANLVRESDRLQDLLQQFDQVIDLTLDDLKPHKSLPLAPLQMEATLQPVIKPMLLLPDAESKGDASCLVADVLEPLLASAQVIAQERHLNIQSKIPPNLPPVRASARTLREVLSNLIDNALKYTPAGGRISIQAGQERGNLQGIAISDTGPGIPPQDLEHIFERHYRGIQAETEIPGTGLGLAIAKELVEQMQGEIEVRSPSLSHAESSGAGHGTTFTVWLPSVPQNPSRDHPHN